MPLTIGELAARARVNVQTVRYYERRGLVLPPARNRAGYRQYSLEAADRIRFIRRAQELGFSLVEIEDLLALRFRHGFACADVEARARDKIRLVEWKIGELERIRRSLESLVAACPTREPTSECPILEALEEPID
jgi:MerR family transcriptional regulator, copper efflux regulator